MRFIGDEISRGRRERIGGKVGGGGDGTEEKREETLGRGEMIELKGKMERWRERWKQPLARKWLPPVAIDR